jgi:Methyltransferase FkbM domain
VGLKSAVLSFLERRNYAVVHADALRTEREIAAENQVRLENLDQHLARLRTLEANIVPPDEPGRRPALHVQPFAPPPGANDLQAFAGIFDDITPWSGIVPAGFEVDFLGTLTSKTFLQPWGDNATIVAGAHLQTPRPRLGGGANGEFWFEAADWVQAAREARNRFVMVTLGALYGYQAVGSQRALQLLNPMPYTLVAVEPDPENMEWTRRHMRDNGIDPDRHWLLQAAIGPTNQPAFFPVGSPGSGAPNCISSNEAIARKNYLEGFIARDQCEDALKSLLLHNTTGLHKDLIEGKNFFAEIKLVSTITLQDVLGPFERVDLLESDIQESEIVVFPPFRDLLKSKVHRIHIGTHGKDVHRYLLKMFHDDGWDVVFSYEPESQHETIFGTVLTNDGVLSLRNPAV